MIVRWRADGPGGDWRELQPVPSTNAGFTEKSSYAFEQPRPGWSFQIDDEPLPEHPDSEGAWRWAPGFFAGEVTAELIDIEGRVAGLFLLDVAPDPAKLREGRRIFLSDVDKILKRFPFTHVSRPDITAAGLTAVAADPVYGRTWGRGWRALRHGLESDRETERLWISPNLGDLRAVVPGEAWRGAQGALDPCRLYL